VAAQVDLPQPPRLRNVPAVRTFLTAKRTLALRSAHPTGNVPATQDLVGQQGPQPPFHGITDHADLDQLRNWDPSVVSSQSQARTQAQPFAIVLHNLGSESVPQPQAEAQQELNLKLNLNIVTAALRLLRLHHRHWSLQQPRL
jgi:hypothetical protein